MKAEIELTKGGDVAQAIVSYSLCKAEPDVGYMEDWFEFEIESYTTFGEDGEALPEVNGIDLEITDYIYGQLVDAANDDMDCQPERVTRACDIKESLMAPLFESLGQDFKNLSIRGKS